MSGFNDVEAPVGGLDTPGTQQAANELTQILAIEDGENNSDQVNATDPGEPEQTQQTEPEQIAQEAPDDLAAEAADGTEQPGVEDSGHDPEPEQTFTVKVEGVEQEVTLNTLKQGFLRQSDYTRSKQELARQQEELGSRAGAIEQQRTEYDGLLTVAKQRLEALIPPEPDWAAMAQRDPIEHTRQRAAWDNLQSNVKTVETEQARIAEERQRAVAENHQKYMAAQRERILAAKPELADKEKAQKFFSDLTQYAVNEYGFHPQEIASVMDHRQLLMAEKAMKYDALQTGSKGKVEPTTEVPTLKPGGKPAAAARPSTKRLREARKRLERTGSTDDAAGAIEALM